MQIVPVIDILNGLVVHGRAGLRESYRPIESQLTDSVAPLEVIRVLMETASAKTAYVADLDGLMNQNVQTQVLNQLADAKIELMIDAGIRSADDVSRLPSGDHVRLVLASETIPSVQVLRQIVASHPNRRFVFSFDLMDDVLRSPIEKWTAKPLGDLASLVWDLGVCDWIVLDVRSVGMTTGPTTVARCRQLKASYPEARIITGGGIRDSLDLDALKDLGISSVLLATALHNRSITDTQIQALQRQ